MTEPLGNPKERLLRPLAWPRNDDSQKDSPPYVIARSPYFGRRGNLWYPRGIGERKSEIATHPTGARNDEGEGGPRNDEKRNKISQNNRKKSQKRGIFLKIQNIFFSKLLTLLLTF